MIRGAFLHLLNEQPLLVDLAAMPGPGDAAIVCTNIRMTNGRRPAWVGNGEHWFLFPLAQVRFLEVPAAPSTEDAAEPGRGAGTPSAEEPDLELDEELLRRIRET
ncbi:MAG: hypothetical protein M0Z49_09370 [Chloroflexi bacterium]|nr:hypothetical protein [Chloroflexota bacterium]